MIESQKVMPDPNCAVTGQGAGVAAAVSLEENVPCRQVDIAKVQKALERQGVRTR